LPDREEDKQFNLNESMATLRDRLKHLEEENALAATGDAFAGRAIKAFAAKLGKDGVEKLAASWGVSPATIDRIARRLAGKAGADLEQADIKIMKERWAKLSDAEKEALRKGTTTPVSNTTSGAIATTTNAVKPSVPFGEPPPKGTSVVPAKPQGALVPAKYSELEKIKTIEQVPPEYRSKIADVLRNNKGMTIAAAIIAAGLGDQLLKKLNPTTTTTTTQDKKSVAPVTPTTGQDNKPPEDPNAADMAALKALYDQFMAAKGESGGQDFEPQLADAIKRYEALLNGQSGKPKQPEFRDSSYASKGEDHMKGTDGSNLLFPVLKESDELARWLKIARG
jgi:hypothetical protein